MCISHRRHLTHPSHASSNDYAVHWHCQRMNIFLFSIFLPQSFQINKVVNNTCSSRRSQVFSTQYTSTQYKVHTWFFFFFFFFLFSCFISTTAQHLYSQYKMTSKIQRKRSHCARASIVVLFVHSWK